MFFEIFQMERPEGASGVKKKFQKTLILAFQKTLILAFEVIVQLPEYT